MTQKRTWTFLNNCNTVLEYGFEIILTLTCANTQQSSVLTMYLFVRLQYYILHA